MSIVSKFHKLTERELLGYREWLMDLSREAEESGDFNTCDEEVWEQFDPAFDTGMQVYQSFSDAELLDFLIATMDRQGHKPRYDRIFTIYRRYIQTRFGGLNNAKDRARIRMKQQEEEVKWPPDWHTRVSAAPLLAKLEKKGKNPSEEEWLLLESLCKEAQETGMPPYISISVRDRLNKLMDYKSALETMGIPCLSNTSLKRMARYWQSHRQKKDDGKVDAL